MPTAQVLNYYVIEKWEFDKRSNQTKTRVMAICPILNRIGDYGEETRYPMFWIKFDQLRPFLSQQYVFLSDDNNLARYSLDDYFTLGMYDGDIVKTKNLRNLSMMQMYPDPDDLRAAQDSIDNRLRNFGGNLWVPSREEYLAQQEAKEALENGENSDIPDREVGEGQDKRPTLAPPAPTPVQRKPRKQESPNTAPAPTLRLPNALCDGAVTDLTAPSTTHFTNPFLYHPRLRCNQRSLFLFQASGAALSAKRPD